MLMQIPLPAIVDGMFIYKNIIYTITVMEPNIIVQEQLRNMRKRLELVESSLESLQNYILNQGLYHPAGRQEALAAEPEPETEHIEQSAPESANQLPYYFTGSNVRVPNLQNYPSQPHAQSGGGRVNVKTDLQRRRIF